ncbi:sterol desaturase family protein [Sphingomonas sp. ID1715]|uniref:sterol desaturase family protein n=1 Tax=Sphingomonas sp. ID1715 TaxID=1656898 RepID=UPI001488E765|nr:sterol desaturase family protein [Sphingomonas sp. ID1715]NNM78238.1 sterol desaturase family protein [Sphingomonas sp. ID1715]
MFGTYHWIALALFLGFVLVELGGRAQAWPGVTGWRLQGIASTLLYFAVGTFAPLAWDAWLGQYQLVDGSRLPFWAQVVGGFLVLEAFIYAWHRTMHNVRPLWRWFHQMHHSAERLDIWGAFYFHPLDMIGWALLTSLALVLGFGLSGEAALLVNVLATFCSMFQHMNVRTPRWVGYVVQRPESHSLHHKRGHHANNYGDLPLYDMIFGTFANPKDFEAEVGFHAGSSRRIGPMLIGREIA